MLLPTKTHANVQVPTEGEIKKSFLWFRSWKPRNWMTPLDILSRFQFFHPFDSSESACGHKTCRNTLNANLPALPWTGYTVTNTVHTICGIFPAFPQPLCWQYPIQTELKVTSLPKRLINQWNHSVFVEKNHQYHFLPFQNVPPEHKTLRKAMWILMLSLVRRETDAAVPHQRQSP